MLTDTVSNRFTQRTEGAGLEVNGHLVELGNAEDQGFAELILCAKLDELLDVTSHS